MTAEDEKSNEDESSTVDGSNSNNEGGDDNTKARKRKERLEQNRLSARQSRARKKTMIEELQRTVITLSRENKDLNERNEQLRRQLMEIGSKYPNIVPLQAIVGQAAAQGGDLAAKDGATAATGADSSKDAVGSPGASTANKPSSSVMSSLNPMNWLGGNKDAGDSDKQADV